MNSMPPIYILIVHVHTLQSNALATYCTWDQSICMDEQWASHIIVVVQEMLTHKMEACMMELLSKTGHNR